mmetsp:Transcript_68511/g.155257  ORF Transcript_68511/g.155257 Transcript_68511/m.155257 type:complete len:227 (+) Transcript_68511:95-775(+)
MGNCDSSSAAVVVEEEPGSPMMYYFPFAGRGEMAQGFARPQEVSPWRDQCSTLRVIGKLSGRNAAVCRQDSLFSSTANSPCARVQPSRTTSAPSVQSSRRCPPVLGQSMRCTSRTWRTSSVTWGRRVSLANCSVAPLRKRTSLKQQWRSGVGISRGRHPTAGSSMGSSSPLAPIASSSCSTKPQHIGSISSNCLVSRRRLTPSWRGYQSGRLQRRGSQSTLPNCHR